MAPYASILPLMGLLLGAQALNSNETRPVTTFATSVKEATQTSSATSAPTLGSEYDVWNCQYWSSDDDKICNQKGSFQKNMVFTDSLPISFEECVTTCKFDRECNTFYYEDNLCQTFKEFAADSGFNAGSSKGSWYDSTCFNCLKVEERLLSINFEDGNLDNWMLESSSDDFSLDTYSLSAAHDGKTTALRLREMKPSGHGRVEFPAIPLTAGRYRVGFTARNSAQQNTPSGTGWGSLNVEVTSVDGDLYDGPAQGSVKLQPDAFSGWFFWEFGFTAPVDTTAGLAFEVAAEGGYLDWYFDDVFLVKL